MIPCLIAAGLQLLLKYNEDVRVGFKHEFNYLPCTYLGQLGKLLAKLVVDMGMLLQEFLLAEL